MCWQVLLLGLMLGSVLLLLSVLVFVLITKG